MQATATETIINLPATLDPAEITLPEPSVIIARGGPEQIKEKVRKLAEGEANGADATTESGRATLKSVAYKVARSKTAIDDLLKDHAEDARKIVNDVNAARRVIKEGLEELQDELKAPVTKWENAEAERIKRHDDAITALEALVQFDGIPSAAVLGARLSQFKARQPRDWEEYYESAAELITRVEKMLTEGLDKQQRYEKDQADLEEFRADKLRRENEAAAEKARIEQEAADRAADEKRKADLAEAARLAKIEAEQEAEKVAAASHAAFEAQLREKDAVAQRAKDEAAEKVRVAEAARVAAEQKADFERAQAEEAKTQAAATAKKQQEEAIEAERKRVEQARLAQEAADQKRADDIEHVRKINKEVLADIIAAVEITDEIKKLAREEKFADVVNLLARAVITAIARDKVKKVWIDY